MNRVFLILLLAILPAAISAAEDSYGPMADTVVISAGTRFRVERIAEQRFDSLRNIYYAEPEEPVMDMAEVIDMLGPEFSIDYISTSYDDGNDEMGNYGCQLQEFRREGRFRIFISECEGFTGYYPAERILTYHGGHSSDQAFFVDTGHDAWNPQHAARSADGRFRLTGLHDGQDAVEYRIEYGSKDEGFRLLAILSDLTAQLPREETGYTDYIHDPFWAEGTLYFRTGGEENYRIAVTPFADPDRMNLK